MSQAADRYQRLSSTPPGRFLVGRFGLPESTPLRRYEAGQPLLAGPAVVGGAPEHRLLSTVERVLEATNSTALAPDAVTDTTKIAAAVFDASGITSSDDLAKLREFFSPIISRIGASGRLVVLGTPPEHAADRRHHVAQRALEGFVRSAAKELRHGATGNLVYVAPGGEDDLESTLRFLLGSKSAYVSGQVIRVASGESSTPRDWDKPQAGRVVAVTGASRGIGAAIAQTLARDGAHVIAIDIPQQGEDLASVANAIGGATLALDVTAADAPAALAAYLQERHGTVDVVVHNAGITRDRTLARMKPERWDAVLDVNLSAQERLNEALLLGDLIGDGGRIVTVSSIGGIAGNRGQTNYGASKAGVIGIVETLAPELAQRGATINAVAPGFIETQMTAAMPLFVREGGRRMNSLAQGGLPIDVAETIAWFASPASGGVNGNVVRVCGQSLIGA
ncbi:FabG-like 3-oxoacyl-(acyl-carrier-protein) reductase [Baekduia alba]|uniref:3-oxoacyl-ACP reductase n=1 Tax=Baekduia alba TaxID=2997333 RepID=UPI002340C75E|nr:3-oxoacyl-ACP reductase [Baekduia alba]WCB92923.1 FabG-like 3-oxoacyl-(acyl-carrier-protein) reductase [Baekduia alba]